MKKIYIILIIIMLITFSVAISLLFIELTNAKLSYYTVSEEEHVDLTQNIQKIEVISKKTYSINILSTSEDNVTVKLNGGYSSIFNTDMGLLINNKNNVLKIEVAEKGILKYISFGSYSNNTIDLTVYIPEKFIHELDVNATSSELKIQDINTNNISIKGAAADLNVNNISCDVKINEISNNINMEYKKFNNNLEISGISNNITINIPKGSNYVVDNNAIGGKINYYLDNTVNDIVRNASGNKIMLKGVNVVLNVNEYTNETI